MLVVSRKIDESIVIDENIIVTVVGAGREKVRLGVEAPREIPVHRSEVQEKINRSNSGHKENRPKSSKSINVGERYELCNDFEASQWFDFNDYRWKDKSKTSVKPHNCCLFRKAIVK